MNTWEYRLIDLDLGEVSDLSADFNRRQDEVMQELSDYSREGWEAVGEVQLSFKLAPNPSATSAVLQEGGRSNIQRLLLKRRAEN